MSVAKGAEPILTLKDWQRLGGPKRPFQWADGRSAMEVARAWLEIRSPTLPPEVHRLLRSHRDFGECIGWTAEPEARLAFDNFRGEPRNTDLLVIAQDEHGPLLLAVEAKADETYGELVGEALLAAKERLTKNPRSNGVRRLEQLVRALFGIGADELEEVSHLRYQLLTATAGAVAEAERRGISRVVLLVHEFITDRTDDGRHAANDEDLNRFVRQLTDSTYPPENEVLGGGYSLPGLPLFRDNARVFIGKAVRNLRGHAVSTNPK